MKSNNVKRYQAEDVTRDSMRVLIYRYSVEAQEETRCAEVAGPGVPQVLLNLVQFYAKMKYVDNSPRLFQQCILMKITKGQLIVVLEDTSPESHIPRLSDLFPRKSTDVTHSLDDEADKSSYDVSFVKVYVFQILYLLGVLHNTLGYVHR